MELLSPINMSSVEETETEDSNESSPISLAELAEVVKKLLCGRAPGVDEFYPLFSEGSGQNWAVFAVRPLQCCIEGRDSVSPGWWFPFSKRVTGGCAPNIRVSQCSASLGKFTPGVLERRL